MFDTLSYMSGRHSTVQDVRSIFEVEKDVINGF